MSTVSNTSGLEQDTAIAQKLAELESTAITWAIADGLCGTGDEYEDLVDATLELLCNQRNGAIPNPSATQSRQEQVESRRRDVLTELEALEATPPPQGSAGGQFANSRRRYLLDLCIILLAVTVGLALEMLQLVALEQRGWTILSAGALLVVLFLHLPWDHWFYRFQRDFKHRQLQKKANREHVQSWELLSQQTTEEEQRRRAMEWLQNHRKRLLAIYRYHHGRAALARKKNGGVPLPLTLKNSDEEQRDDRANQVSVGAR
ncbi:MAG: hypothetical protein KAY24_05240 [Candidatus Eisenbacteria sp.]|nr:hypothetical protein [Candidatus Eisenbacteria bacterium]